MEDTAYCKNINVEENILAMVLGPLDSFAKKLQKIYKVSIVNRNGELKIIGDTDRVNKAYKVIETLILFAKKNNSLTEQNVDYTIALNETDEKESLIDLDDQIIARTLRGINIKPKTLMQKKYVDSIKQNMITFGIGPAGTGKTYLAMACAISAFKKGDVQRIILTRPAIEAGEKLGFLPGDLQSKVDPYLRPLYDALYQIMGAESFQLNVDKGLIEVAPLAYMRGRTLDNAFIILDEAQNTTISQMKMFLTRIGFNSKVIVTGDNTQKDLDPSIWSGLDNAIKVLRNIEGVEFVYFSSKDVVRHPLVQKIVDAYEKFEKKKHD